MVDAGKEAYGDDGGQRAMAAMLPGAVADAVVEALKGAHVAQEQSASVGELVKALCRAIPNFEEVVKDREAIIPPKDGKSGYKYGYATLASAIGATKPHLAAQDLVVFQTFRQEGGQIELVTELFHGSDQFKRSRLSLAAPSNIGPQALGGFITYLRRYSYFGMLGLAPAEDDDGAEGQRGVEDSNAAVEELGRLAGTDPKSAAAQVARAVKAAMGCGDISEPRLKRLYAIADKSGWASERLDAACAKLLGVAPAKLPWKAYDLTVELFRAASPAVLLDGAAPAGQRQAQQQPSGAAPATAIQDTPPPATPPINLTWRDVWGRIANDYDELPASHSVVDAKTLTAVLQALSSFGWTPEQFEAVIAKELVVKLNQIPADGTNPPVYRKIVQAFKRFNPADVEQVDRIRYGWEAPPPDGIVEQEPPFGDDPGPHSDPFIDPPADGNDPAGASLGALLAPLDAVPTSPDEGWAAIKGVIEAVGAAHPEALVAITPDDRLAIFRASANGNRSSGDVAALVRAHLGVGVEKLPSVVFLAVGRLLTAFPSRAPGKEEPLALLPEDPEKAKPVELRDIVARLVQSGALTNEEVGHSGQGDTVTKADLIKAIAEVRERCLMEAGRA